MTPVEFWDACERFDWYFEMSDDARVYHRGEDAKSALLAHAPAGSVNRATWEAFVAHHYSGPSWGTVGQLKPPRPVEASAEAAPC